MVRFANGRAPCWGNSGVCPIEKIPSQPALANGIGCSTLVGVVDIGGASVRQDGAVLVWGADPTLKQQEWETQTPPWEPVVVPGVPPLTSLSHPGDAVWGLDADGLVWSWGKITPWGIHHEVPTLSPELGAFQSFFASGYFCGLRADGTVWCFGGNKGGQLGDGTLESRFDPRSIDVPASSAYWGDPTASCVATAEGELWCWGVSERLPRGEDVDPLEAATPRPTPMPPVRSGVLGTLSGCAITVESDLYCWGANSAISTVVAPRVPTHVPGAGKVEQAAIGEGFICVIRTDGTVWCGGILTYVRPNDEDDDPYRWDIVDLSHLTGKAP